MNRKSVIADRRSGIELIGMADMPSEIIRLPDLSREVILVKARRLAKASKGLSDNALLRIVDYIGIPIKGFEMLPRNARRRYKHILSSWCKSMGPEDRDQKFLRMPKGKMWDRMASS